MEKQANNIFDRVYLAVGNAEQARVYASHLPELQKEYDTAFCILPDAPDGRRVGSGGALLKALRDAAGYGDFSQQRVLVVLTGGLSTRAPMYSARGKALAGVCADADGGAVPLLRLIMNNAASALSLSTAGVFVCCGDILVDFSGFTAPIRESTVFCVPGSIPAGTRHGVVFPLPDGRAGDYLQKADAQTLRRYAARYGYDAKIPVDTGWFFLSPRHAALFCDVCGAVPDTAFSVFSEFLPALAENESSPEGRKTAGGTLYRAFRSALQGGSMRAVCMEQRFLHFGTTAEILSNAFALSNGADRLLLNSAVETGAVVGAGCLLENVRLAKDVQIGENCIVTDVELSGVQIPAHIAVFGFRLRDGRYAVGVQRIEDDADAAARAAENGWELPQFYPAASFSESYRMYTCGGDHPAPVSLAYCAANADLQYYLDWRQYLSDGHTCVYHPAYLSYRQQILETYFGGRDPIGDLDCVKDRVALTLPARINFSGTWTDCMPYCIENGGEVINAAVKVNGMLPIRVEAMRLDAPVLEMCNDDAGGRIERYVPGEAFPALSDCNLHRAVFSTVGIGPHTVLHSGVRLSVSVSGLMKGSGLGTSSILLYGCFQALNGLLGLRYTETDVLYAVLIAEQLMHTGGGWQDQGGIVCGGFKAVRSAPGIRQMITVEPLACGSAFLRTLSERLVLVSTKQRHFGRYIVTDVMNRYLEGQPQTLRAFGALTDLNAVFREAIAQGDLTKFANGINLHAEALEKLSPLIYNNIINEFSSECRRYTDACSLCGAGGGGYMAAVLKEGVTGRRLADLLHTEVLPVEII